MLLLSSFLCVATCPVDCSLQCTCVVSLFMFVLFVYVRPSCPFSAFHFFSHFFFSHFLCSLRSLFLSFALAF
ncbi:hypothetical protein GLYMA_U031412v4 [Glycine max]|nr:hypothetical protein GLYMA_U031412v4 [Glycine max]KAH1137583.1 hypothetical protein GYH30_027542 [Glycine max]